MSTSCDSKKSNVRNQKLHDDNQELLFESELNESEQDIEMVDTLMGKFLKFINTKQPINEKEFKDTVSKEYGSPNERNEKFLLLKAILEANPSIKAQIDDEAMIQILKIDRKQIIRKKLKQNFDLIKNLPPYKENYTVKEAKQITDYADKNNIKYGDYESPNVVLKRINLEAKSVNYSSLPVNVLNLLYNKAARIVGAGQGANIGVGWLGKLKIELTTALNLGKQENTGAIYTMSKAVINHTRKITMHINRFLSNNNFNDTFIKGDKQSKDRNYGMDDVFDSFLADANNNISKVHKEKMEYADENIIDFFNRYLSGWVKVIDGEFMIAETRDKVPDGKGGFKVYNSTGDPVYEFQNFVTFKEYAKSKNKNKNKSRSDKDSKDRYHRSFKVDALYVEMVEQLTNTKEKKDSIIESYNKAKGIHAEVFQYAKEQFERTHNKLMIELKKYFPNLNSNQIEDLLKSQNLKEEKIYKLLTEKQQDDLSYIIDSFGSYSILDPYFFGAQDFAEKADSFPIIYNQNRFQNIMWEEALNEAKINLKNIKINLETARNNYKDDKNNEDFKNMYFKTKEEENLASSEVIRMEMVRDSFDEYPTDLQGNVIPLQKHVSTLKSITNSFDTRNARSDKNIYSEYLKRMFGGLERNNLSVELLKSLRMAKNNAVKDAIVSQYKGINNDPSARASFFGIPTDLNNVSVFINKIPLVNISTDTLSRKIRTFNSWITGMHLRKVSTAILNYTAIIEGFFHVGTKNMTNAYTAWKNEPDAVSKLVALAGIVDFSEFIQKGLVNKATDMDLTDVEANRVVTAVLKFWKDRSVGVNQNKALKELRKVLIVEFENVPSMKRIKGRKKIMRQKRLKSAVNVFASFAIDKQYQVKKSIKFIPYRKIAGGVKAWGTLLKNSKLTMSDTETELRTWQFVAAITSAMDSGLIKRQKLSDLKGDDLKAAVEIGAMYVQISAFSVGRENIGEISRGEVGGFLTKFKYYAMQKFAADISKFQNAFDELHDYTKSGSQLKTVSKLFKEIVGLGKSQNVSRTTSPNVAALKTFLVTQGIITQLIDVLIFGPFAVAKFVPGARNLVYMIPGMKTIGGSTSDLLSLSMLIPNLLIALAFGWGEDEDELKDLFEYYMRKSAIGYGATWTYENFLLLLHIMQQSDAEELARDIKRSISPVIPSEIKHIPAFNKLVDYVADEIN
tara:strand:+ start:9743 stop:13306 length:3564 start_codon:yes stop_codon:yes gene_type:complete